GDAGGVAVSEYWLGVFIELVAADRHESDSRNDFAPGVQFLHEAARAIELAVVAGGAIDTVIDAATEHDVADLRRAAKFDEVADRVRSARVANERQFRRPALRQHLIHSRGELGALLVRAGSARLRDRVVIP